MNQELLAYNFTALEPYIDAQTMQIHYSVHHAGHVTSLRKALGSVHVEAASASSLVRTMDLLTSRGERTALQLGGDIENGMPDDVRAAIRRSSSAHMNHTLFWRYMAPRGSVPAQPRGKLATALRSEFGSFDQFRHAFAAAAMKRFGSGWAWLSYHKKNGLFISTTADEENPLMMDAVPESEFGRPILCLDLWEHAYYLKYQNRRADYIAAWWNVVNWPRVEQSFAVVTTTSA